MPPRAPAEAARRAAHYAVSGPGRRNGGRGWSVGAAVDRGCPLMGPGEPNDRDQRQKQPGGGQEDVICRQHERLSVNLLIEKLQALVGTEPLRLQRRERLPAGAAGAQMLGELCVMQGRAAVPQRRYD